MLAAVSNGCAEPDGGGLPLPSGSARRVIRPQAVPPTRIAPMIANASRHPCDDTPMCATASVALYPATAAGVANSSAIAARMSGDPATAKASCPAPSVTAPATIPTTIAPITPAPLWNAARPAVTLANYVASHDMWRARGNRFCGARMRTSYATYLCVDDRPPPLRGRFAHARRTVQGPNRDRPQSPK